MKPPSQLDDGDRNIPIAEKSRRNMGATLYHALTRIRRDEGVDPERYPPVKCDIAYDTKRSMIGAEITARETADILIPVIRSQAAGQTTTPKGWLGKIALSVIAICCLTTTVFSWLSYQTARSAHQIDQEASTVRLRRDDYLRAAYLGKAFFLHKNDISITPSPEAFEITFSEKITGEAFPVKITVPHQIPPEEYKNLLPQK